MSVTTKLGCGDVAGTIGQIVAYPLDIIRRTMQMCAVKNAASVVTGKRKTPLKYEFSKTVQNL